MENISCKPANPLAAGESLPGGVTHFPPQTAVAPVHGISAGHSTVAL